jgi:hypothetical protein
MSDGPMSMLPEERFGPLRHALQERVRDMGNQVCAGGFESLLDGVMRSCLMDGFAAVHADEGTVWLLNEDRTALVPRLNTGPKAAEFVGKFSQPLTIGMISVVVATEQPMCENDVYKNAQQDKSLDQRLGLLTCAMLAVPFAFGGALRGVISCVRVKPAGSESPDPPMFRMEDLQRLQSTTSMLQRLVDYRMLATCLQL